MTTLPTRVYVVDFEYSEDENYLPSPICLVAREVHSGRVDKIWLADDPPEECPINFEGALYVAYAASAEIACHLALGWGLPPNVLDLYVEEFNLRTWKECWDRSLLDVASAHGLSGMASAEKDAMQQLCIAGGPFSYIERQRILDYCEADVDLTARLLEKLWERIDLRDALMRGDYAKEAAREERVGIPIDVEKLEQVKKSWVDIKPKLIEQVDQQYGVYHGTVFSDKLFHQYLHRRGIKWLTRHGNGTLDKSDKVFKSMAKIHPELGPLRELRRTCSQMNSLDLKIGSDARCRFSVMPFSAKTGRNQPRGREFPFGRAKWFRSFIKPKEGQALAYIDWDAQEFGIAAALSQDPAMMDAYQSPDPHLAFATQAGAVPVGATKHTHGAERDRFKIVNLGVLMGMGVKGLTEQLGDNRQAKKIILQHQRIYHRFWQWSESVIDHVKQGDSFYTYLGWALHNHQKLKSTSIRNFPLQATGAEMLRLASITITGHGHRICCPIHDAFLIEDDADSIESTVAEVQELMADASAAILDGFRLKTSADIVRYPDRYYDEDGKDFWHKIQRLVGEYAS